MSDTPPTATAADSQPSSDAQAVPLLGDISLECVQRVEHALDAGFDRVRIAGLAGEVMQRTGRPSHRIHVAGVLFGDGASDELQKLQKAAAAGEELTFAADITTALDLQRVVITWFRAAAQAGVPDRYDYELTLVESPPLPPPAEVEGFGGLDDFGSDLGFDTSALDDIENAANAASELADKARDVVDQLGALANLDGLSMGGLLQPLDGEVGKIGGISGRFSDAANTTSEGLHK
jgi:hypothetical protein